MLCLEWCAFLTEGAQADDYEEMAEKRQRKFEAIKRWRMHLVVAAIPFFLHLSLFLFLAGLWLRLRDVNHRLRLIVGVPGLVIAISYVVVTLLPIFTEAPFSTSASDLIKPVVDSIRTIVEIGRFIRPPPAFLWIAKLGRFVRSHPASRRIASPLPGGGLSRIDGSFTSGMPHLITFLKRTCGIVRQCIHTIWKTIALLPIVPTFKLGQNPFDELSGLRVGQEGQDKEIHLRALFWLISTPLSQDEVKGILDEFQKRFRSGGSLDRAIVKLLVLSLSSILEDGRVSAAEQPIFDHCTTVLAEEMDQAFTFRDGRHSQRIPFRRITTPNELLYHFHLTTSGKATPSRQPDSATSQEKQNDYWKRTVAALWLCPSMETIREVVGSLDPKMQSMEVPPPQKIIRGLHAAALACACFDPDNFDDELVPYFNIKSWNSGPPNKDLDKALSGYLQSLFVAYYKTLKKSGTPTTATSLVVDCLKALDNEQNRVTLNLHNALFFFVVVTQRGDPKVFEEGPSIAHALLESVENWNKYNEKYSIGAGVLATRLSAIAYGQRPLLFGTKYPLERLAILYASLPESIKKDQECFEGFLDARAATMEAVLAVGSRFASFAWQRSLGDRTGDLFSIPDAFEFVSQHPNHRLPYLYSLAITLLYTPSPGRNQGVVDLLVLRDETDEGDLEIDEKEVCEEGISEKETDERKRTAIDRALDTNILVVIILRSALQGRFETAGRERKEILKLLVKATVQGIDWRTRWKSIYLIADLAVLLSKMNIQCAEEMGTLAHEAGKSLEGVSLECVPSDWERKREGLLLCKQEGEVKNLSLKVGTGEAVYEWSDSENIPYLSLYNPPHTTYLAAAAAMFQQ